ncbi:sarcosine oxidase subunit delta [Rhizobium leguminosarum]|nr:sarcosine oxidase subunit delta [Rhizobium leguminosarum]
MFGHSAGCRSYLQALRSTETHKVLRPDALGRGN